MNKKGRKVKAKSGVTNRILIKIKVLKITHGVRFGSIYTVLKLE